MAPTASPALRAPPGGAGAPNDRADAPLAITSAVDQAALSSSTFEELIRRLTAVLPPIVGAQTCGVMLLLPEHEVLQMLPGSHGLTEALAVSSRVAVDDVRSGAVRVLHAGAPAIFNDATNDPSLLREYLRVWNVQRLMMFPLSVGERPVGVFQIGSRPAPLAHADVALIEPFLAHIAIAVEHVRKVVQLRRKEALESVLSHMGEAIASGLPLERFLQPVFEELCATTNARIAALSGVGSEPFLLRAGDLDADLADEFLRENERDTDAVRVAISPPDANDPGWAALHVPVLISERRVACISLIRRRSEPFSSDERQALSRLASLAALAWATDLRLLQQSEVARLRERQRIADDLHDHVAQLLFSGKISLESLLEFDDLSPDQRAAVDRSFSLLTRGEQAIRDVIHALAEPEPEEVTARLLRLVQRLDEEFGIAVHLELQPLDRSGLPEVPRATTRLILKAAREGIVNAAKHAGPCRISVALRLTHPHRLLLTVWDDGLGAPSGAIVDGYGLASLRREARQQGGCLRLSRGHCGGTKLTVGVPL